MTPWPAAYRYRRTVLFIVTVLVTVLAASGWSQKVKVGYDKSVDFAQYQTYSWADLSHPVGRPLLYRLIVMTVDSELQEKGLKRVEGKGDLLLFPAGGVDATFAMSAGAPVGNFLDVPLSVSTGSWVGPFTLTSGGMSPMVNAGTLMIAFVEHKRGRLVWEGHVSDKFDTDRRKESAERVQKCIAKLLKDFPPRAK
jgi:Domain of unknown function (DUF4136)